MAVLAGSASLVAEARNPVAVAGRSSLAAVDLAGSRVGLVDRYRRNSLGWMAGVARRCRVRRPCASARDTEEVVRPGYSLSVIRWRRAIWTEMEKSQDDVRICSPSLDTSRAWITLFGVAEAAL